MYAQRFEPMSVGQILDRAFRLYRSNFIRFVVIVAIIQVPIALIQHAVSPGTVERETWQTETSEGVTYNFQQGAQVPALVGLLFMVAQLLCTAALTKSVSESYLGNQVTVGRAYAAVLPRLLILIIALILLVLVFMGVGVIGALSMLALREVGIFVMFALMLAVFVRVVLTVQAIVIERAGPYAGIKRSWVLTARNFWRTLGLLLLLVLILLVTMLLFWFAGGLVVGGTGSLFSPSGSLTLSLIIVAGQILATPIWAGALILLYYDLRIRKEGFDLQMLAQDLGSAAREVPEHGVPPVQY